MIDYLLLVEKPSAAQNFAHILGGQSGTFDGKSYQIARLAGHVLEYVEPYKMERFSSLEDWEWLMTRLNN